MEVDNGFSFLRSARLHRRTNSEGSDRSFQANVVPSPVLREDLYQSSLNFTERLCEISMCLAQVVSTDERREKVRIALEVMRVPISACVFFSFKKKLKQQRKRETESLTKKIITYLRKSTSAYFPGNKPRYFGFAFVPRCRISHGYSGRNRKSRTHSSQ